MSDLLSVKEALRRILDGVAPNPAEQIELSEAAGRVLADDTSANRTQPPFAASAMDGYAVRATDIENAPCSLSLVGESAAGHRFSGRVDVGECARIFTGAPVPDGADTIVIQENVIADGSTIHIQQTEAEGRYVRPAGLDFREGDVLLKAGQEMDASTVSLAAAMNHATLSVRRKPKVAIIASGDELMVPGSVPGPDQIIASNSFGVAEIVRNAGGEPIDLGIARDTLGSLAEKFALARSADIVITLGGASVGEHDLVRDALKNNGVDLNFWKLAMRPGKPVMFGASSDGSRISRFIGLPGNPVSSLVCALVFVVPLIRAHLGLDPTTPTSPALLAVDLPANDQREEYMRATATERNGQWHVSPFDNQDSSILSLMARATCLMIRPAHAPAATAGDPCTIIRL